MSEDTFYIVPEPTHNQLVEQAYAARGFDAGEQACAARFSAHATRHGIRTHNALKALHLDDLFGSKKGRMHPLGQNRGHPWPLFCLRGLEL